MLYPAELSGLVIFLRPLLLTHEGTVGDLNLSSVHFDGTRFPRRRDLWLASEILVVLLHILIHLLAPFQAN